MKNFLIWAIAISLLLAGVLYYSVENITVSSSVEGETSSIDLPESDTAFGGLFYSPNITDSIPHYLHKKITDSVAEVKKSLSFEGQRQAYRGYSVGFIGVAKLKVYNQRNHLIAFLDSLNSLRSKLSNPADSSPITYNQKKIDSLIQLYGSNTINKDETIYCISLRSYKMENNSSFFIQNGGYHLAYVAWDSSRKSSKMNARFGYYARKEIPVMYSQNQKTVYIPVVKSTYKMAGAILNIWFFVLLFYSILVLLILPIFILLSISGGKVFTARNILGLKIIAYSLLFFTALKISEPFILHAIFKAKIPNEMRQMSFREILNDSLPLVIITLIVFLIWKAFQKGFKLQQQEDLTV